jgi:hypothetical protein
MSEYPFVENLYSLDAVMLKMRISEELQSFKLAYPLQEYSNVSISGITCKSAFHEAMLVVISRNYLTTRLHI